MVLFIQQLKIPYGFWLQAFPCSNILIWKYNFDALCWSFFNSALIDFAFLPFSLHALHCSDELHFWSLQSWEAWMWVYKLIFRSIVLLWIRDCSDRRDSRQEKFDWEILSDMLSRNGQKLCSSKSYSSFKCVDLNRKNDCLWKIRFIQFVDRYYLIQFYNISCTWTAFF